MYGLCMGESSQIFLCDKWNRATDVKWSPEADDLVTGMTLIGQAFTMPERDNYMCYLDTTVMKRINGDHSLFMDPMNSKKVVSADLREPAFLNEEPVGQFANWYSGVGEYFELPLSNYTDPEGHQVVLNVVLRQALKFARFDR